MAEALLLAIAVFLLVGGPPLLELLVEWGFRISDRIAALRRKQSSSDGTR